MINNVAYIFPSEVKNIFLAHLVIFIDVQRGQLPVELCRLCVRIYNHDPIDRNPEYHLVIAIILQSNILKSSFLKH